MICSPTLISLLVIACPALAAEQTARPSPHMPNTSKTKERWLAADQLINAWIVYTMISGLSLILRSPKGDYH